MWRWNYLQNWTFLWKWCKVERTATGSGVCGYFESGDLFIMQPHSALGYESNWIWRRSVYNAASPARAEVCFGAVPPFPVCVMPLCTVWHYVCVLALCTMWSLCGTMWRLSGTMLETPNTFGWVATFPAECGWLEPTRHISFAPIIRWSRSWESDSQSRNRNIANANFRAQLGLQELNTNFRFVWQAN